jgi:glycosyltransferase involved in cell wall biosynthesis
VTAPPEGVSVIVMTYNEAGSLEGVVQEIATTLAAIGRPHEIVIIDDGSSDGSGIVAARLAESLLPVRVVTHDVNRGLGGVYRTGFVSAQLELVTFFPADGQFPAEILRQYVPLMANHDLVLGYIEQGPDTLWADALARAERLLYRLLFGKLPRFQGVFMIRHTVLERMRLRSQGRGWAVVMEMIIRVARGRYRVQSVPIALRPRQSGRSKVRNLRTIVSNLVQVLQLARHV